MYGPTVMCEGKVGKWCPENGRINVHDKERNGNEIVEQVNRKPQSGY